MLLSEPTLSTPQAIQVSLKAALQVTVLLLIGLASSSSGTPIQPHQSSFGKNEATRRLGSNQNDVNGQLQYASDGLYGVGRSSSRPRWFQDRPREDVNELQLLQNFQDRDFQGGHVQSAPRAGPTMPEVDLDLIPTEVLANLFNSLSATPEVGGRAKRNKHLRLSLTNNIDVLREKLYAELARRSLLRNQSQVENANEGLASIG
ncbi:hypothetical protein TCAL_04724 [Tigriopus californicus]|uniref:Corticotropin-releasing factor domain-containing protein n=1 Tax=Tigriopus californicus TaxID=6832 RepID=A0A553PTD3_TIGCA|nr:uncharacterized protein LOC131892258 [Tigriopus californicus]XP_059098034.1 uncharacterized protein LOC131892258 [Tigriopus californicus]TRY80940.1 hypothetical protein TCAL_04724 [Tigriopus californicus]|eukprot:TCALIF_04724-PA protein Name:"Protein of unknown function" AED:0.16 eAED:0.16 QI:190/1/1/1/0.5/0.66/3/621/203